MVNDAHLIKYLLQHGKHSIIYYIILSRFLQSFDISGFILLIVHALVTT